MELKVILGVIAVVLGIIFIRYVFNRASEGLPGLNAVAAFILLAVTGFPLTVIFLYLTFVLQKLFRSKGSNRFDVLGMCVGFILQWVIWSQLIAYILQSL